MTIRYITTKLRPKIGKTQKIINEHKYSEKRLSTHHCPDNIRADEERSHRLQELTGRHTVQLPLQTHRHTHLKLPTHNQAEHLHVHVKRYFITLPKSIQFH